MPFYSYFCEEDERGEKVFSFRTDHHAIYSVVFDPCQYLLWVERYPNLLEKGVGFAIYKHSDGYRKFEDLKVRPTIIKITQDYLSECSEEIVLLYHCDSEDGRQSARSKLFKKWFIMCSSKCGFDHVEMSIVDENEHKTHFMGYFIAKTNKKSEKIYDEFISFGSDLMVQKNP